MDVIDADAEHFAATALISREFGWTLEQVEELGPARELVLDFLANRRTTSRRTFRQRVTTLHWRTRHAMWLLRRRTLRHRTT